MLSLFIVLFITVVSSGDHHGSYGEVVACSTNSGWVDKLCVDCGGHDVEIECFTDDIYSSDFKSWDGKTVSGAFLEQVECPDGYVLTGVCVSDPAAGAAQCGGSMVQVRCSELEPHIAIKDTCSTQSNGKCSELATGACFADNADGCNG